MGAALFKRKRPRTTESSHGSSASTASVRVPERMSTPRSASSGSDSDEATTGVSAVLRKRNKTSQRRAAGQTASTGFGRLRSASDASASSNDDEDWTDRFGETAHEVGTSGAADVGKRKRGIDGLLEGIDSDIQVADSVALKSGSQTNQDGLYRGAKNYSSYLPTRDSGQSSKFTAAAAKGPIRGTQHIRTITTVDYQPDVCKDYKETGYCGFGDTCKFLHDRSDYLAGWQMDTLANSSARQAEAGSEEEPEDDGDDIPFACLLCRKPFADPVVTQCGHYFCSACAIKRYSKTGKCFACGAQTHGLFNSATRLLEKMAHKREEAAKAREARRSRWEVTRPDDPQSNEDAGTQSGADDDKA